MDYQVWVKNEYDDNYTKTDCGDEAAASRAVWAALFGGREPILTQAIPYETSLKIKADQKGAPLKVSGGLEPAPKKVKKEEPVEADKGKAEPD